MYSNQSTSLTRESILTKRRSVKKMQQCWKTTSPVNDAVLLTRGLCQSRGKATRRVSALFTNK